METESAATVRPTKLLLFSGSLVPSLVAGALAWSEGSFSLAVFMLLLLGVLLGQTGGDYAYYYLTNEYSSRRGEQASVLPPLRPLLAETHLRGRGLLVAGGLCLLADLVLAIYFTFKAGVLVVALAMAGGLLALLFAPLVRLGLREVAVFLAFGPLPVIGVHYVLTGRVSLEALAASAPLGLWVAVIGHFKGAYQQLMPECPSARRLTLGERKVTVLYVLAYMSLMGGVAARLMPVATLLALATIPFAIGTVRVMRRRSGPTADYFLATVWSIITLLSGGLLMAAGYVIPLVGTAAATSP
ncbi:MAG: prenyltransferase [Acidobacteriota bacterium]